MRLRRPFRILALFFAAAIAVASPVGPATAPAAPVPGEFEGAGVEPALRDIARAGGDSVIAILSARTGLGERETRALEARGVRVLGPLPGRTFVVRLEREALRSAARGALPHPLVSAIRRPRDEERADERVRAREFDAFARLPDGAVALHASVAPDVPLAEAATAAESLGARVSGRVKSLHLLVLEAPEPSIPRLLERDGTFLRLAQAGPPLHALNDDLRATMGVPAVSEPPLSLDGSGVTVLVFDQGVASSSHPDLAGRVTPIEAASVTVHATHTTGTLAGSGAVDPRYRGVAPGASVLSASYPSCSPQCLYNNPQDIEEDYSLAHVSMGARLNSNSLGANVNLNGYPCEWEGAYETTAALLDAIVAGSLGPKVTSVWAAGNERSSTRCGSYLTVGVPATAKNVISVGATDSSNGSVASFSSFGPTRDGRLKPEIVAPGCQTGGDGGITSTVPPSHYAALCGTSMSTPAVAGVIALGLERFSELRPGEADPLPSTLKALLCHTATDIGEPGPDYQSGFGAVDTARFVEHVESALFVEDSVSDRAAARYDVTVAPGDPEIAVTLAWSDPPASLAAAVQLVNDLDLVLVDPAGALARPFVLAPSAPAAEATTGVDRLNPIERVRVAAPAAGTWRVLVEGHAVTTGSQVFSLVTSHALVPSPARDLGVADVAADYDPLDPEDVDPGPGRAGDAVDLLALVSNGGSFPVTSARVRATAFIPGLGTVEKEATIADFDPVLAGDQPLEPGAVHSERLPFGAGELPSPGTYDLVVESIAADLVCDVGGAPAAGDEIAFNDLLRDVDDRLLSPDDDLSPDALDLRTHSFDVALPPESLVIENPAVEKVLLDLRLFGLLASGPRRPVHFRFDLYRASGALVQSDVRARVVRTIKATIDKSATLRVGLSGVVALPRNVPLVIRVAGTDTDLDEVVVTGTSPEFVVSL